MKEWHITKKKLISLSGISETEYQKVKRKEDVNLLTIRKICFSLSISITKMFEFKNKDI